VTKYHPHGDQSIYDTLVLRMAQDFSLRYTLVDSQEPGRSDGDNAAAMRYTGAAWLVAGEIWPACQGHSRLRPLTTMARREPSVFTGYGFRTC
jgi:hypothetical protein